MGKESSPKKPDGAVVTLGEHDLVEVVDLSWDDPRAEVNDGALFKVADSTPPDDVTKVGDGIALARVLDRNAVPTRVRVEMVTSPLSAASVEVLRAVNGEATVAEIIARSQLSEDAATAALQQLVELGVIAFR